jgi:cell surface protein SprA
VATNDLAEDEPKSGLFLPRSPKPGEYPRNDLNNAYGPADQPPIPPSGTSRMSTGELEDAGLVLGVDFEKIEMPGCSPPGSIPSMIKLGYISLNTALNTDEILAVAYEYTYRGQTYQVGNLSQSSGISAPSSLILKLMKPTNFTPNSYTWGLMMKNVYALGAYQVSEQ